MGSPKALLSVRDGDQSFLSHLLSVFERSQAQPTVVVLGYHADRIREATDFGAAQIAANESPERGMLSSIQTGIAALAETDVEGALICPVDHPEVTPGIVNALIERFEATGAPVVVPVHQDRRGHPVLFSRAVFSELETAPEEVGARRVVWDHENEVVTVCLDRSGVTQDIDTPEEYRRWSGGKNPG